MDVFMEVVGFLLTVFTAKPAKLFSRCFVYTTSIGVMTRGSYNFVNRTLTNTEVDEGKDLNRGSRNSPEIKEEDIFQLEKPTKITFRY